MSTSFGATFVLKNVIYAFWNEVDNDVPKFNPRIAQGYAVSEMGGVEGYIHNVFIILIDMEPADARIF